MAVQMHHREIIEQIGAIANLLTYVSMPERSRRRYDHRIRQAMVSSGNPHLFPHLRIPRSTTRTWIRRGSPRVVMSGGKDHDTASLHQEIVRLKAKADFYFAIASVLLVLVRIFGYNTGHVLDRELRHSQQRLGNETAM